MMVVMMVVVMVLLFFLHGAQVVVALFLSNHGAISFGNILGGEAGKSMNVTLFFEFFFPLRRASLIMLVLNLGNVKIERSTSLAEGSGITLELLKIRCMFALCVWCKGV